ncbi:MAG: glycosyltransferase family 4 protein [Candidatus Binatus sp.]|uniref:glycosyltransferase family 4 protein n=1 Tax=Candidatus Binatus sp. TaxID=2811406 RepID=UPI0027216B56|nr:glycosyltransferase family 4 protein [Candidatus Binatus sp.]MDO8435053.1 glycosyltransferase family 4 protein [Candidatus Binatus sp.]
MPRPIRICHVITRLIVGGAQENTLYTAIGQHRNPAFEVTLIAGIDHGREGNLHDRAHAAGVNLRLTPLLVRPIRPVTDLRAHLELYRIFRAGQFDVVHTHSSKAGIVGRVAARMAHVPVVIHTLHSLVFHKYQSEVANQVYIRLKRRCAAFTDVLISVNDQTAKGAIAERIGRPEQHVTIHSGMELEPFLTIGDRLSAADAKRRLGIAPEALVVGKVARLFPLKGHDQFLEAAVRIAAGQPRAKFLLVGDGSLRDSLEARARTLGIHDRLVFAGLVSPEEIPVCFQAMDVVVHTSLREGIARVLPQAGTVGKPVVTFDLDGAPEVIKDGVSGYLVPPLDTAALAERVLELLADPDRRAAFGRAGRTFATEHFSADLMVRRINEVYFSQLSRRQQLDELAALPIQGIDRNSGALN